VRRAPIAANFGAVRRVHPALSYSVTRRRDDRLAPMHLLLSLILICSFFILIIAGLISVLRDMLRRDWPAAPAAAALDLDLPADFNHPVRREIEPIHDLRGIAIQESE
jgi:multisubunit Na+/H+ antiporter MnhE subunit